MDDQVDSEIEDMGMVKEKIINVTPPLGVVVVNQICQSVEKVYSSSIFYPIPSPSKDVCEVWCGVKQPCLAGPEGPDVLVWGLQKLVH